MFNAWSLIIPSLRRLKSWSQDKASEYAGVTRQSWFRWERGTVVPRLKKLDHIARGVGCSTEEVGYVYATVLQLHYARKLVESGKLDSARQLTAATIGPVPELNGGEIPPEHLAATTLDSVERVTGFLHNLFGGLVRLFDLRRNAAGGESAATDDAGRERYEKLSVLHDQVMTLITEVLVAEKPAEEKSPP